MKKLKIGVSSCLLGERVRYNGEHKRDPTVINLLSQQFKAMSVYPDREETETYHGSTQPIDLENRLALNIL